MLWTPSGAALFSPILKIPFLIVGQTLVHNAYLPPNPPPEKTEAAKFGKPDTFSHPSVTAYVSGFGRVSVMATDRDKDPDH